MTTPPTSTRSVPSVGALRETPRSALFAVLMALPGALLVGGLTSLGQQYLPEGLRSLANSAGGWTMFAYLLVWLGRARPGLAAVLGLVAFEAMNEAYGVVSGWRGYFYAAPFSTVWTLVGLAAGPVIGVAASLRRHGGPFWRLLAVTPLSAVLLGEGCWALQTVADTTSPVYWTLEIGLSILFMIIALRAAGPWTHRLIALAVWLGGSAAYVVLVTVALS